MIMMKVIFYFFVGEKRIGIKKNYPVGSIISRLVLFIDGTRMLLNVTENNRIHSIELKLRELPFI